MNSITDFINNAINESQNDLPVLTFVGSVENGKAYGYGLGFGTPDNPMKPEEVKKLVANSKIKYEDPYPNRPEWIFPYVSMGVTPEISWGDPKEFVVIK